MDQDERIECYVCADASAPLMSDICSCKKRYIHAQCQKKLIETLETDGRCRVCRKHYTNVQLLIHRSHNKKRMCLVILVGTFIGSGCAASVLALNSMYTYFFISDFKSWSACLSFCPNSTVGNVSCIETSIENELCVNLKSIIQSFIQAGFVTVLLTAFLCMFAGMHFVRLIRTLPKYHERQEIHFLSDDVSDTRVPVSASLGGACARTGETSLRASSDSDDTLE